MVTGRILWAMSSTARTVMGTLRCPFLLLTPVCVALGLACVAWSGHPLPLARAAAALIGALAAHVSVNMFNEWHDFRSGLDKLTQRTPFSGGSGALPANPAATQLTLLGACVSCGLAGGMGLWLLWVQQSWALLPLGLMGLLLVIAYTPWITRHPLLCLLAPGIGFGPLMVGGTQLAITGEHHGGTYAVSLVPLMLVSGLLLLNQFPDVQADRAVGRRHLPMVWGRPRAARLLVRLVAAGQLLPLLGVLMGWLPRPALLALLTAPLAWLVGLGAIVHADNLPALVPTMGRNVALTLLLPLMLAVGLAWSALSGL
jgi:1,4-dihydroxy-2-naphthoate polyprenyltransferase